MLSYPGRLYQIAGAMLAMALCGPSAMAANSPSGLVQGDWLVRAGAARLAPVGMQSNIAVIGGNVETPDETGPTLDISYFLTDHWALQLAGGVASTAYRLTDSAFGDFDIGTVKAATLALMAQYHFRPGAALNPYLGAGVARSHTLRVNPADNIPDFDVDSLNSVMLGAGLDYHLSGHWFASAAMVYISVPTYHFEGEGFSAEVNMDTLLTGLGLGYRL